MELLLTGIKDFPAKEIIVNGENLARNDCSIAQFHGVWMIMAVKKKALKMQS